MASVGMFRGALAFRRGIVPADAVCDGKAMADGMHPYAIVHADGADPTWSTALKLQQPKVFWFFFSKKNALHSCPVPYFRNTNVAQFPSTSIFSKSV